AVLFRRNRIIDRSRHLLQARHVDFVSAGCAAVGAHCAVNDHGSFLREMIGRLELFVTDGGFRHDRLNESRAVAYGEEMDLSARAAVVQPPADRHALGGVFSDVFDVDDHYGVDAGGGVENRSAGAASSWSFVRACSARSSTAFGPSVFRTSNINLP